MLDPARLAAHGNTGNTRSVAKVMISLPDELLARIDAEAERRGESRSAVIRGYAAAALEGRNEALAARMRELGARPRKGEGGRGTEIIRAARDQR